MMAYKWWQYATGLVIPMEIAKTSNNSWLGVVLNPIGYGLTRESNDKASDNYYAANPINLEGINGAEQYEILKNQWVDGCAANLKANDPTKSLNNASRACDQNWNSDAGVQAFTSTYFDMRDAADQEAKAQTEKLIKILLLMLVVGLAIWFILKIV